MNGKFEPKIVGYLCTWCSYTGADTAGISRIKYPGNLRAIRVPCSGRVSPELIMRTFDQGADGVLVLGCHIGECHYDNGNHRTAKRLPILKTLMEFTGLEPERLRLDWVSASEGERFSRIVTEFTQEVSALGPTKWQNHTESTGLRYVGSRSAEMSQPRVATFSSRFDQYVEKTEAIQEKARELLAKDQVNCVIGYEVGPRGRTRPAFIHHVDEVDRLVWNQDCSHNLATYLRQKLHPSQKSSSDEKRQRVAIVVKPCDSRAINVLLSENQFDREQVYVIGMTCEGIFNKEGASRQFASHHLPEKFSVQDRCVHCTERTPVLCDFLIGDPPDSSIIPESPGDDELEGILSLSPAERAAFWTEQFDRCIRCYACRQVCPLCNCPTCLYERDDSLWVGMGTGINEKRAFHLGRAYHLAGRCVGCNECERVCPMNIPISLLNRVLAKEMESLYDFRAGIALGPSPLLTVLRGVEG